MHAVYTYAYKEGERVKLLHFLQNINDVNDNIHT